MTTAGGAAKKEIKISQPGSGLPRMHNCAEHSGQAGTRLKISIIRNSPHTQNTGRKKSITSRRSWQVTYMKLNKFKSLSPKDNLSHVRIKLLVTQYGSGKEDLNVNSLQNDTQSVRRTDIPRTTDDERAKNGNT